MTTLAPSYDPTTFESRLYQEWESTGVFQSNARQSRLTDELLRVRAARSASSRFLVHNEGLR